MYEADGITPIKDRTDITVKYTAGVTLPSTLEKGQSVKFTIRAKTLGNKGKETLPLELSVTSAYLSAPGSNAKTDTLINYNTSFTRLPSFGIVKTITNGLDLNDVNDTATYQVVVTNDRTDFSADATDITIEDFLPDGLKMAKELTADNITVSTGATKGTITPGSAGSKGFTITGVDLPIGQNITITFTVVQDGTITITPTVAESLINHVTVTDDLDNDPDTINTVIDSTKTGAPENVSTFYPADDLNNLNGEVAVNPGDDSTVPLLTIERKLTLTGPTVREIAPSTGLTSGEKDGQVTHETVITNTGKDVEGSKPGELTFTIKDNDGAAPDAINIVPSTVKVTYYPNGNDTTTPTITNKTITAVNGVYDLSTALPSGIAPNGTVTIKYNVSANEAPMFDPVTSTDNSKATFEDTIVTLIPGGEGKPKPLTVTDKTTVRGLVLVKKQAIAEDCAAASPGIVGNFVTTDIGGKNDPTNTTVLPGQCIVYQIEARNTSSDTAGSTGLGFDITDITIVDKFSKFLANANYVPGSVTAVNGTAAETSTDVKTTIGTLAPQATATMQFKVKIKTARVVTPTP